MNRFERVFIISMLVVITALCSASLFRRPISCLSQESTETSEDFDLVGRTYYSCSIEGQQIQSEWWSELLEGRQLSERPLMVVWHSALGCRACNQYVLDRIKKMDSAGLPVLIIGADYRSEVSSESNVYLGRDESLGLSAEDLKTPFVFIYDDEIRHLFFPDSRNDAAFDLFLDVVVKRYGQS